MNIIKKIVMFFKTIFVKQDKIKTLKEPQIIEQSKNNSFKESLQSEKSIPNKKIEVLVCEGDGLGIQKKISF